MKISSHTSNFSEKYENINKISEANSKSDLMN